MNKHQWVPLKLSFSVFEKNAKSLADPPFFIFKHCSEKSQNISNCWLHFSSYACKGDGVVRQIKKDLVFFGVLVKERYQHL